MNDEPENEAKNQGQESNKKDALFSPELITRSEAARLMGRSRSAAKAKAARLNGRKGGRPAGQKADEATRQRMKAAQQKRRDEEKNAASNS